MGTRGMTGGVQGGQGRDRRCYVCREQETFGQAVDRKITLIRPFSAISQTSQNHNEKAVNVDCELGICMRACLREVQAMRCAECYVMLSNC